MLEELQKKFKNVAAVTELVNPNLPRFHGKRYSTKLPGRYDYITNFEPF